jgi:hypothetical protein
MVEFFVLTKSPSNAHSDMNVYVLQHATATTDHVQPIRSRLYLDTVKRSAYETCMVTSLYTV